MVGCENQIAVPISRKYASHESICTVSISRTTVSRLARDCMRKMHKEVYGEPPADDLSPPGLYSERRCRVLLLPCPAAVDGKVQP
jgi:hypothetical protein